MLELSLASVESDLRNTYSGLLIRYGVGESERHDAPPAIVFQDGGASAYAPPRRVTAKPLRELTRRKLAVAAEIWGRSKANAEGLLCELIRSLQDNKPGAFTLEMDEPTADQEVRQHGYVIMLAFTLSVGVLARPRSSVVIKATELLPLDAVPGDGHLDATE